jgi:dipeptide/tripeptide permease
MKFFWNYNLICVEVATSNLSHIVSFSFLFWTLYKQGGMVIPFHIKNFVHMGWANQKVQPKTKKQIMHISKVFTLLTYLST